MRLIGAVKGTECDPQGEQLYNVAEDSYPLRTKKEQQQGKYKGKEKCVAYIQ